jgi:hypothetical protein
LNPAGSCAASPNGPVPDGAQLTDITQNPGVAGGAGGAAPPPAAPAPPAAPNNKPAPPAADPAPAPAPAPAPGAKSFTLQNGKDAIALNQKFAGLTAGSACTDGEQACVGDSFAQCVGGKFALTGCAGGTTCAALPLVNKAGTSIACTTPADRDARIAATGATAGAAPAVNNAAAAPKPAAPKPAAPKPAAPAAPAGAKPFTLQNGKDAKALNQKFAGLSASSSCTNGQQACVGNSFAQCVGGKFVLTQCAGGTTCAALPLVNKAGTSITCTTAADRDARIAATGA